MLRHGGANHCPYCGEGDCPVHDSEGAETEVSDRAASWIQLYRDCKRWRSLPDPGGLLDQESRVMERLNIVADEFEEWQAEQEKLAMQRAQNKATLGGSGPGAQTWGYQRGR